MEKSIQNHKIFSVGDSNFEEVALGIFRFQYDNNSVYKSYVDLLRVDPAGVVSLDEIPFLPVRFFASHTVRTTAFDPEIIFESSGTSDKGISRHHVKDLTLYEESFTKAFHHFYGNPKGGCIIGLLPSYLERKNSSLVYMVEKLIAQTKYPQSGFYLNEYEKLSAVLGEREKKGKKTILFGVSFALLDLAEKFSLDLDHTIIIETGGMKGRREELIRPELHALLKRAFGLPAIHSEYGMTELLSQAYSKEGGIFHCPPWMKVMIREEDDPFSVGSRQSAVSSQQSSVVSRQSAVGSLQSSETQSPLAIKTGVINIMDLANINSCSFIATDDAGKIYSDGSFEVLGRIDGSDQRGCSLMFA